MIRRLAQCPYCNGCEIGLDDHPELVFNPEGANQTPCAHLAWVDGRYSQWDHTSQGVNRAIGSVEFRWDPDEPNAAERTDQLLPYLHELLESGVSWVNAPAEPFVIQTLNADEKATDAAGKVYVLWDVDGWAIFAEKPSAFWSALPACQERQLGSLDVEDAG